MDDTPITPAYNIDDLDAAPTDSTPDQAMAEIELANSMNNLENISTQPAPEAQSIEQPVAPAETPIATPVETAPIASDTAASEAPAEPVAQTPNQFATEPNLAATPANPTAAPAAQATPTAPVAGKKSHAGVIVLIIILLLAGVGVGGYFAWQAIKPLEKKMADISQDDKKSDDEKKSDDADDDDKDADDEKKSDNKDSDDKKDDEKGNGGGTSQKPVNKSDYTVAICGSHVYVKNPDTQFAFTTTKDVCKDEDTGIGAVLIGGLVRKLDDEMLEELKDEDANFALGGVAVAYTGHINYDDISQDASEMFDFKEVRTVGNKTIVAFVAKDTFFNELIGEEELSEEDQEILNDMLDSIKVMRTFLFDENTYYFEGDSTSAKANL